MRQSDATGSRYAKSIDVMMLIAIAVFVSAVDHCQLERVAALGQHCDLDRLA